tara:strand:- start:8402 stop:10645 length:2244 start_codon:yes stop_codon:yes gene_type:complete
VSNKDNKTLSEGFLNAFSNKSKQVFGSHVEVTETEAQIIEKRVYALDQKIKAAYKGGFGDIRELKEERQELLRTLDNLEEAATPQMMAAAKELESYAKKNGGVDKADFMKAAKILASGKAGTNLIKFVDDQDTEVREKIITVMGTHMGNKTVGKMFGVKIREETVSEISKKTLTRYAMSADNDVQKRRSNRPAGKGDESDPKIGKRLDKISLAHKKGAFKEEAEQLDEMKNTHALIDTADGNKVVAMASSEQGVKQSRASAERPPMSIKNKNTLKIVTLTKPQSQKASEKMIGSALPSNMDKFPTNVSASQGKMMEGAYDKAFDTSELAEKFAGAVGGIVREMSGKFYVFDKASLEEAASLELAKKVKSLDDETDDKKQEAELDKVNPKAVKKKFKDRKDKDIDNDGDEDDSDEYLHKRRKAISKAVAKDDMDESKKASLAKELSKASATTKKGKKAVTLKKAPWDKNEELEEAKQVLAHGGKGQYKAVGGDGVVDVKYKGKVVATGDFDRGADGWFISFKGQKGQKFFDDAQKMVDFLAKNKVTEVYEEVESSDAKKPELDEGRMKELHDLISRGMSAKDIAKKMKLDIKTIQALVPVDEASKEGTIRIIDLGRMGKGKGFQVQRMTKGKFVDQGKPYKSQKDAEKVRTDGQHSMQFEAKKSDYTISHKTFSSAVQHALEHVEKLGYTVDEDEWFRKVSSGPKKPSSGKTNSYAIDLMKGGKETRRKLQMQVYYDQGRYELNMYVS